MVVCDPSARIQDLRRLVKQDTGISAPSLTKQDICDAYASMGSGIVLPPMRMSRDRSYLIDVASPLEVKDYKVLFRKSSTIGELKSVARKVKAVLVDGAKKDDIVTAIQDRLNRLNVAEPVQLRTTSRKKTANTKQPAPVVAAETVIPVTNGNIVNTREMVNNTKNVIANEEARRVNNTKNVIAKEEEARRVNANAKISNLQTTLNTTKDPNAQNAIRRNLNAARQENARARKEANNRIASVSRRQNQMASNVSSALNRQNQKAANRNVAALSAISAAKANVSREIANIEQMRMKQVSNSKAAQNALANEQRILKEQLKTANTEIAQEKARQALELVEFKRQLESNFEKRQKNALATIQAQRNVAVQKVNSANTDLEKMKAKQELEFQERLLNMKIKEKTFLEQRLNGMLNLTEKERGDFKKMYETSSLDEVIQKASELNEQKGLNKKVTEAFVMNAKKEAANAKVKENAATKELQAAKNAQMKAEQALRNARNAQQQKAAQTAANNARKVFENATRKLEVAQKEKAFNSSALVAQLTTLVEQAKKTPASTNNVQAQNLKNAQVAKLEAELRNAKQKMVTANRNANAQIQAAKTNANAQIQAAKRNANAQIQAAKTNANAAKRNAATAANAKIKAERALQNAANANRKKRQNDLNAATRQSNNAQRKLQEELRNVKKLITQLESQPRAVANTSGIAQLQTQMVALQEEIGKQNRIPGVKPPNANAGVPKPTPPPNANAGVPKPTPPPNANAGVPKPVNSNNNNIGKRLNKSQTIQNARLALAKKQELARVEEQEREVERALEEARKKDEEGRRLAMEREEANRKIREAKNDAERQAAEKAKQLANEQIARVAQEKIMLNQKANLFSVGGDEKYLKKYLMATGQELGSVNAAGYKEKVLKDIKLAQLEANAKPAGFFGKAKPKLDYVNDRSYNTRLRLAETKLSNVAKVEGEKADIQRLLKMGGDRQYLNAYKKSMNNVPLSNINANAYTRKLKKDLEYAIKVQQLNGTSVPKLTFIPGTNQNYANLMNTVNKKLANKREQNKIASEDKAKVNSLLAVAPGVTMDYLQAFSKSRNVNVKNITTNALANKVKEDEEIRGMMEQLQGKGIFKTKPKLVFISNAATEKEKLQKQLNNKKKAEENKAASIELSQQEAKLLKELSRNLGVNTAYLKAYANGKSFQNLNKNALKAKINKNREIAKILATAVKSSFTGKYANAKPVLKFIKNANYNAILESATRNMNARVLNRNEKNAAAKTKSNTKQLTKNTRALIAKIASNAKVSTSYIDAFLADNAHKIFDAQKLNANRSALNAKITKDMEVAKMKATSVKGLMGKYANGTPKLVYIPTGTYNSVRNAENASMKERQTQSNTKQLTKNTRALIAKIASNAKVSTSYIDAFLADNAHKIFDAQKLNANASKLKEKIAKDMEVAKMKVTSVKGITGKYKNGTPKLVYIPTGTYNSIRNAENASMKERQTQANTKQLTKNTRALVMKLAKGGPIKVDTAYVEAFLADDAHKIFDASKLNANRSKLNAKIKADDELADLLSKNGGPKKRMRYVKISDYADTKTKAEENLKTRLDRVQKKNVEKRMNIVVKPKNENVEKRMNIVVKPKNENVEKRANVVTKPKLTLNVAKSELKKYVAQGKSLNSARRLLSPKYHPNRGGTKENFQTLENAYEALKKNATATPKEETKPNTREQLKIEAARKNEKNGFQNASNKTFNERNAELGREKTRLVQRVNKNIPGVFGQYRRTWQSNIRSAKNKNTLDAIEKLLNEKVRLRTEITNAKIPEKDRSGQLRWVMQKKNDVQKRRQELARQLNAAKKKANENAAAAAAKKKANENTAAAAAKKKANENTAAAAAKKKANENAAAAAAKKKANENAAAAAAKKKKDAERDALKMEIRASNIGVKNRNRFVRDLNAGKDASGVRKLFNAKKKITKSKTVQQLQATSKKPAVVPPPTPAPAPRAFANLAKKKELAGKLRLAAKKSVAQNIRKSNLGNKSKMQLLGQLKQKKVGPTRVQADLKKKMNSGGMRAIRARKQMNQKFSFGAKDTKPTKNASWRLK